MQYKVSLALSIILHSKAEVYIYQKWILYRKRTVATTEGSVLLFDTCSNSGNLSSYDFKTLYIQFSRYYIYYMGAFLESA
jgi:hypothetical protein